MSLTWLAVTGITIAFVILYVYLRVAMKVRRTMHGMSVFTWFVHLARQFEVPPRGGELK